MFATDVDSEEETYTYRGSSTRNVQTKVFDIKTTTGKSYPGEALAQENSDSDESSDEDGDGADYDKIADDAQAVAPRRSAAVRLVPGVTRYSEQAQAVSRSLHAAEGRRGPFRQMLFQADR